MKWGPPIEEIGRGHSTILTSRETRRSKEELKDSSEKGDLTISMGKEERWSKWELLHRKDEGGSTIHMGEEAK
jgi:hypothetical protein